MQNLPCIELRYKTTICKWSISKVFKERNHSWLEARVLKPLSPGMGYTDDVLVSKMFRDLRLMSIGGGADEVMLGILCKFMGTSPEMR